MHPKKWVWEWKKNRMKGSRGYSPLLSFFQKTFSHIFSKGHTSLLPPRLPCIHQQALSEHLRQPNTELGWDHGENYPWPLSSRNHRFAKKWAQKWTIWKEPKERGVPNAESPGEEVTCSGLHYWGRLCKEWVSASTSAVSVPSPGSRGRRACAAGGSNRWWGYREGKGSL